MTVGEGGKTIRLGDESWLITKDDARVEWVDLICEGRCVNGIVNISFLQAIMDVGTVPEAHVNVRLRMNLVAAQALHNLLGSMISDAFNPSNKEKAN